MKSKMTLRMGKMLEARTAPGNQRRASAAEKGDGRMGCDLKCTRREGSQRGNKERREVAGMGMNQREWNNKDRKAH